MATYEITGEMKVYFTDPELHRSVIEGHELLQDRIRDYVKELLCAAGILAVSNMGLGRPCRSDVQRALESKRFNLDTFVVWFGEQYMENDDAYDTFMAEAAMWVKLLSEEDDWRRGSWAEIYTDLVQYRPSNADIIRKYYFLAPADWPGREDGFPHKQPVMEGMDFSPNAAEIPPAKVVENYVSFKWERGNYKGRPAWRILGTYKGKTIIVDHGPMS